MTPGLGTDLALVLDSPGPVLAFQDTATPAASVGCFRNDEVAGVGEGIVGCEEIAVPHDRSWESRAEETVELEMAATSGFVVVNSHMLLLGQYRQNPSTYQRDLPSDLVSLNLAELLSLEIVHWDFADEWVVSRAAQTSNAVGFAET